MARKSSAIINEPKPDWVSLWRAPYHCFSRNYIHSAREWADALQAEVQKIIKSERWKEAVVGDIYKILREEGISPEDFWPGFAQEWSFDFDRKRPRAWITAMGIRTTIEPALVVVRPWNVDTQEDHFDRWLILACW
jgi:hypothetical protein